MRKVTFKFYRNNHPTEPNGWVEGEGVFHRWAEGYVEFENGPGNYTYAIVETPNGEIQEVLPTHLKFINP